MQRIPDELRRDMEADPFYKKCCYRGVTAEKIDWHHNLTFGGRQLNEKWAILPLARSIHNRVHEPLIKEYCDWIMLNRADADTLRRYSKAIDYVAMKSRLNAKYGTPRGIELAI